MMDINENDIQTWEYLKDNFSKSKSEILFTSIGSDHAMEQENKNLKVRGGVIGLTQKPSALYHFCLTVPILNALSDEYCKKCDIQHCSKRKSHYQLTGSHLKRFCENVKKLTAEMGDCGVTLCDNDAVFYVT